MSLQKASYRSSIGYADYRSARAALKPAPERSQKQAFEILPPPVRLSVRSRAQGIYTPIKRVLDFVSAAVLIVILSPLFLLTALVVRLSSRGPIVFRQRRLTDGGREFTMFKFRTMYENAESATGAVWAKTRDPRITPIGRFLRKTHWDELPQLFNVLRGEMSLIGPRPERPELVTALEQQLPSFRRRMEVRAGITGLAQTSNGYAFSIDSYRKKLAFDILYVKNHCFLLDLRIAVRTVYVMLTGDGAR